MNGEVVLFADTVTSSMKTLLRVSDYRREKQEKYNIEHNITPTSVKRAVQESLHTILKAREVEQNILHEDAATFDAQELIRELEREMADAAARLEYERAALLRDQITELKSGTSPTSSSRVTYPKPSRKFASKSSKKSAQPKPVKPAP